MSKIIIASGPVIVADDKVLLNRHGADKFWKFCGGRVADFEREGLKAAARREAREEIGVTPEITNSEPFIMYADKEEGGEKIDVILVHYLAALPAGAKITPGADILEVAWINLRDLAEGGAAAADLAPNILPALRHFGFIK